MTVKPLEISVDKLVKVENNKTLRAFVDIVINQAFMVKGLRVIEGKNGLFVCMPQSLAKDENWYATVYPLSNEVYEEIQRVVFAAYHKE